MPIILRPRVARCLQRRGIDPADLDALAQLSPRRLMDIPGFGRQSLNALREHLLSHGRDFAELDSPHLAITTPEQARAAWLSAVADRDRAVQAVREARELWRRLEREATLQKRKAAQSC